MHWQHRFNHMVGRYNDIYRVQMPNITPHVCRHTYCSNMAKSGMNPKTLQYLMGHSDISVTMNVYTHIGFDDAEEELKRMEEFRKAQAEVEQKKEKPMSQKMFKVSPILLNPCYIIRKSNAFISLTPSCVCVKSQSNAITIFS